MVHFMPWRNFSYLFHSNLVAHRAIIDIMMRLNVLFLKCLTRFCLLCFPAATRDEGTATQSRAASPGASGGDRTATGAGSTPKCCHCLSKEEDSGILLPHMSWLIGYISQ